MSKDKVKVYAYRLIVLFVLGVVGVLTPAGSGSNSTDLQLKNRQVGGLALALPLLGADLPSAETQLALTDSQRSLVAQYNVVEYPLSQSEIRRAEEIKQRLDPNGERRSPMTGPCNVEALPLEMWFANYTIDRDGREIVTSTGWSPEERSRFSNFLCRMLPVIEDIYGAPFQRWSVTLVKDMRYSGGWIFIPSVLEIHSDGNWNPRLLTHELVHAFRGQRTVTSDQYWQYINTLSGFEEGFGEGVAYLAMNEYTRRFCNRGDCSAVDVPSRVIWQSFHEWMYDFSNDDSMTTEDFWSDSGGTFKYYERYLVAAAAIMKLEAIIPDFSRRFNEEYYAWINADPNFRPTRETMILVMEALTDQIEGIPVREWVDRQHIFDSRTVVGKKDWITNRTPYGDIASENVFSLYFLETFPLDSFPRGSEWAHYIASCPRVYDPEVQGEYLFYRLHGQPGVLNLYNGWNDALRGTFTTAMQTPRHWGGYRVRGCNDVRGLFEYDQLRFGNTAQCTSPDIDRPVCIARPPDFGLYYLETDWQNPHYQVPPSPPDYGMPYDQTQDTISQRYYTLAGRAPADYSPTRDKFVGGIIGARNGTLRITHSSRTGEVVVPVVNGAFYAAVPTCQTWPMRDDCWAGPYAEWSNEVVTAPGTLTFTFLDESGIEYVEKRAVVFGNMGKHKFLLKRDLKR